MWKNLSGASVEIFLWMKYNRINCKICVKSAGNSAVFSDADECIFVKTMSHIRQVEKILIEVHLIILI